MLLLAGCALMAEDTREVAPVLAAPAPTAELPSPSPENELPTTRAAVLVLPIAGKSQSMHVGNAASVARGPASAAGRQQELPALKMAEQAPAPAAGLAQSAKGSLKEETKASGKVSAKASAKALPGPAWLKGCQHRQQQGDVIMCDADSLLVQPSDKVMVYVRDVKLSRKPSDGPGIAMRESLPRLYRFFVLE